MAYDSAAPRTTRSFVAYMCTDDGAAVARAVLENGDDDLHGGGLSGAARLAEELDPDRIVLAEIGTIPVDMACECVEEIRNTGAHVIVLGAQTDIATYRALLKAGATEYFTFPARAEDILAVDIAPAKPSVVIEMPRPVSRAPSIAVIGSNGGVGASLLAQNLAHHAASTRGGARRTALLDADFRFGSQAIDLDRDETAGLFEALMAPDRIDDTFLHATMDHLSEHLSLYSQQVRAGQDAGPFDRNLARLLPPLRAGFDTVITDLPRHVLMAQPELAADIDVAALVIPAGFSGVNAATRLIARLREETPDLVILPVLSELRPDAGLSKKDIARTLELDIAATLPRSEAPLMRAHRAAKPLVLCQPRGPYGKAVKTILAAALAAQPKEAATAETSGWLKKVLG